MKLAELGNSILESRSGGEAKQVPARSCRYYTRFPSGRPVMVSGSHSGVSFRLGFETEGLDQEGRG